MYAASDQKRRGKYKTACEELKSILGLAGLTGGPKGLNEKGTCGKPRGTFDPYHYGEFDPGSERTLAAWIRHASRTRIWETKFSDKVFRRKVAEG